MADSAENEGLANRPQNDAHVSQTAENDAWREPPEGWFTFGTHVDQPVRLEFSDEVGEDLLPLWERPIPPEAIGDPEAVGEATIRFVDEHPLGGAGAPMSDACPECGGTEWSTASDGLGDVASVAAVCLSCRYVTVSVVDLTCVLPPGAGE